MLFLINSYIANKHFQALAIVGLMDGVTCDYVSYDGAILLFHGVLPIFTVFIKSLL